MNTLALPYRSTANSFSFSLVYPGAIRKLSLFLKILVIGMAALCLWQNNQIIEKTYSLQGMENKLAGLKEENAGLEKSLFQENSFSNLEKIVKSLNMEIVEKVTFIEIKYSNTVVAR